MSYLSSPLWLLFMIVGGIVAATSAAPSGDAATGPVSSATVANSESSSLAWTLLRDYRSLWLFVGTMLLLLLPKAWSFLLLLMNREKLAAHGGEGKAALSVFLETLVSVLIAPILMAFHTTFIVFALLGHSVHWGPQRRGESAISLHEAFDAHGGHTVAGLAAAIATWTLAPSLFWWLTPVFFSLIFSVPISILLSSASLGARTRKAGLLLIPEETRQPRVLDRMHLFLARQEEETRRRGRIDAISQMLVDPALFAVHLELLAATGHDTQRAREKVRQVALYGGPRYLKRKQKLALLADPQSLQWLHRAVWRQWPRRWLKAASLP